MLGIAIALAARAGQHPAAAFLVREWAQSLDVDGHCGPSAIKSLSPGLGMSDADAIREVEAAATLLGLVPVGRGRGAVGGAGFIRLPSALRSRGRAGARKRYYMRRWTVGCT